MDTIQTGYHNFLNDIKLARSGLQTAAKGANQIAVTAATGMNTAYEIYDKTTNPWRWFPQTSDPKLLFYDKIYSATTNPFYIPNQILENYAKKQI